MAKAENEQKIDERIYLVSNERDHNFSIDYPFKKKIKTVNLLSKCEEGTPRGKFKKTGFKLGETELAAFKKVGYIKSMIDRNVISIRMVG